MKKALLGVVLSLAINAVHADDAVLSQSVKDMLTTLKNKKQTSQLKQALATQGTGQLLLRDAIYLYHLPVRAGYLQSLVGMGCDIFQLVLDVESGYSDIFITEGITSTGYSLPYPDRIDANAAMFAYALYSGYSDKSFSLWDVKNYGKGGTQSVGTATAFGYCFSTNPAAYVAYCDEQRDQCFLSSEIK